MQIIDDSNDPNKTVDQYLIDTINIYQEMSHFNNKTTDSYNNISKLYNDKLDEKISDKIRMRLHKIIE